MIGRNIWLLAAALCLPQVASAAYVDTITAQNPLFYWRLNETSGTTISALVDNSPTASGGGTLGATPTVLIGQSSGNALRPDDFLGFEAGNTWFTLPGTASGDFIGAITNPTTAGSSGAGSVSGFFRTSTGATGSVATSHGRIYQGDAGATGALYAFVDGTRKVGLRIANGSNDSTVLADIRTVGTYADNEWHHFAATWDDATNAVALYVDGGEAAGGETVTGIYVDGTVFTFTGRHQFGKGPNNATLYQGSLDEMAIWNTAITAAQAQAQYLAAVPEPGVMSLVGVAAPLVARRRR